jgi:hypothetical protein
MRQAATPNSAACWSRLDRPSTFLSLLPQGPAHGPVLRFYRRHMNLEQLDWEALERMRQAFLAGSAVGPYWQGDKDLASYDATFGERIGWKWDAVIKELGLRGWSPPAGPLADWGCGSGIAGRRVLAAFGPERFGRLQLWDHAPAATSYAAGRARQAFPELAVEIASPDALFREAPGTLLLSHVVTELTPADRQPLLDLARRAAAIIWVEPGSYDASRRLGEWREALRNEFRPVAPCPHQGFCGALAPGNERHWCHFFASPSVEAFTDPNWARFGQRMGIDLRSLPYSFVVMERRPDAPSLASGGDLARLLAEPRLYKGFARVLTCTESGVDDLEAQKRADARLWRRLRKGRDLHLYRLSSADGRVQQAVPAVDAAEVEEEAP